MPGTVTAWPSHIGGDSQGWPPWTLLAGPLIVVALGLLCYPLVEVGLASAPPFQFAVLRVIVAGSGLLLTATILHRPQPAGRVVWIRLGLVGLFSSAIGIAGMVLAGGQISPALATILNGLQPLFAALLAHRLLPGEIDPRYRAGLGLGFLGVPLVALPGESASMIEASPAAVAWVLFAAASGALGMVVLRQLRGAVDPLTGIGWQYLIAALLLLPFAAIREGGQNIDWNPQFLGALLILALLGSALATWLWFVLVSRMDLNRLNTYTLLLPVGMLLVELQARGTQLVVMQWIGIALVCTAAGLASRAPHDLRADSNPADSNLASTNRQAGKTHG